jgi:hypothetical protein
MEFDTNWWGVYAFPLGTLICFGPVIVAWALAERREEPAAEKNRKNKR